MDINLPVPVTSSCIASSVLSIGTLVPVPKTVNRVNMNHGVQFLIKAIVSSSAGKPPLSHQSNVF